MFHAGGLVQVTYPVRSVAYVLADSFIPSVESDAENLGANATSLPVRRSLFGYYFSHIYYTGGFCIKVAKYHHRGQVPSR